MATSPSPVAILYTVDEDGEAHPLQILNEGGEVRVLSVRDLDHLQVQREIRDELRAIRALLAQLADED